jgi:hypothetical protein
MYLYRLQITWDYKIKTRKICGEVHQTNIPSEAVEVHELVQLRLVVRHKWA